MEGDNFNNADQDQPKKTGTAIQSDQYGDEVNNFKVN